MVTWFAGNKSLSNHSLPSLKRKETLAIVVIPGVQKYGSSMTENPLIIGCLSQSKNCVSVIS